MSYLALSLITLVIGFVIGRKTSSNVSDEKLQVMRTEAKQAFSERTEDRKKEIIEYMNREVEFRKQIEDCHPGSTQQGFKRSDIERLLDVSDKTALKYLNELEVEGRIVQVGEGGPYVHYRLK